MKNYHGFLCVTVGCYTYITLNKHTVIDMFCS